MQRLATTILPHLWEATTVTEGLPGQVMDVFVDDQYVYLAHSGGNRFTVVDKVSGSVVPDTPALPGTGRAVFADGQTLYVGHEGAPYLTAVALPQ